MIDYNNHTAPPTDHDLCLVWHSNRPGSGHIAHFDISRENVIRCIWIDRLPAPPPENDPDNDPGLAPISDYIM